MSGKKIKIGEMFAGVGGFHLGLSRASDNYEVVWADQYEPGRKSQFAFNIYKHNFPDTNVVNEDISKVNKNGLPDMDLLVGGFPCQDYSVATSTAKGLYGKKGVLWWDIKDVIEAKWPEFIFLENVDRLLTSPGVKSLNPGRDFGMILRTLSDLGYAVSWKMINAADYGFPQRRRRTFIFASREDTKYKADIKEAVDKRKVPEYLKTLAPFSSNLKNSKIENLSEVDLNEYHDLSEFSEKFQLKKGFKHTGMMVDGITYMADYTPLEIQNGMKLGDVVIPNEPNENLYLTPEKEAKFKELKAGFHTTKVNKAGHEYKYGMGKIPFPDPLNRPARTMVTSEHTVSRMSHVIKDPGNHRYRLISANEAENINTFPEGWTDVEGVTESNRYFTMGNALVVDLVRDIGISIEEIFKNDVRNDNFKSEKTVEKVVH